jgi:hypothetical protein
MDSTGASGSPGGLAALTIDATGLVVNPAGALRGVKSAEKDAVFCVDLANDHDPGLLILQRTGSTLALSALAGDYRFHLVTSGADAASHRVDVTAVEDSRVGTACPSGRRSPFSPAG